MGTTRQLGPGIASWAMALLDGSKAAVGEAINRARRGKGMSEDDLCKAIGCLPATLRCWEAGWQSVSWRYRDKLEQTLGIDIWAMQGRPRPPRDRPPTHEG